MALTRRQFIGGLAVGGAAAGLGFSFLSGVAGSTSTGRNLAGGASLPGLFTQPLRIPPELAPVRSDGDGDHYEITHQVDSAEILPGVSTSIWGYNGIFPRPDNREPQWPADLDPAHQRTNGSHRRPSPWGTNAARI